MTGNQRFFYIPRSTRAVALYAGVISETTYEDSFPSEAKRSIDLNFVSVMTFIGSGI